MNIQADPTSSNLASAMLNSKTRPRAVVGYGVKIFHPSRPNYVTRSPGWSCLLAFLQFQHWPVWQQVYSSGKFVLKASHWSVNVHWDIVVMKSFGGKFATCSARNYRGLQFSPIGVNMKMRLESKIVSNSRKQAVLLTKFCCSIHLAALSKCLIYFCSIRGYVTF